MGMVRRTWLVGSLVLAGGCTGAAPEKVLAPAKAATSSAPPAPAPVPPRKLDGVPVALVLRKPTGVPGTEWAWLLPDHKLQTLTDPDANGRREILGSAFFVGPRGMLVAREQSGELSLAADGGVHKLGKLDSVGFDGEGKSVLAWTDKEWALFDRAGKKTREGWINNVTPFLLPSGDLVESHPRGARVLGRDLGVRLDSPSCETLHSLFATAQRLVCHQFPNAKRPAARMVTLAFDSGEQVADSRLAIGLPSSYAVSEDGKTLAIAADTVEVLPLTAGPPWPSSRVLTRRAKADNWRAPRLAFSKDGKTLCVEEARQTLILDLAKKGAPPAAPRAEKGAVTTCLFAPRRDIAVGPLPARAQVEWDALVVKFPLSEGFEAVPRELATNSEVNGIEGQAVSFDRRTAALAEQKVTTEGQKVTTRMQVVLVDPASGSVKRVLPLASVVTTTYDRPEISDLELSNDGKLLRACARGLFAEGCRVLDIATGATMEAWQFARPGPTLPAPVRWWGAIPEAKIAETAGALGLPLEDQAKVVAWKDDGAFVSVELQRPDGSTLRLNVPDAADRFIVDLAVLAGGSMLGLAYRGVIELWSVEPLEVRALLIPVDRGAVAFFNDGSVEALDGGATSLACLRGDALYPIEQCGDVWAARGTLTKWMLPAKTKAR